MSQQLISEPVDIFQLPSATHKAAAGSQITIGDLHGNAMKLMFMLVKHGIATNINNQDYKRLVDIYKTPTDELTKQHLVEFNRILSQLKFNNKALVRLIGDELADRGNNDYFTLKILEKLSEHQVPVEILVSNHSVEFIEACEKQDDFHAPMLFGTHALSMEKLQELVEKGIVSREEILDIATKHYKPMLRAISYTLSEDGKEITIHSHAGIGLNTIKNLTQKLQISYKDASALELAQTIDHINAEFQKHVKSNTVSSLYTREKMEEGYSGYADLTDSPFEFIMWNRLYDKIQRPANYLGYKINFVHGHDSADRTIDNICNLDNQLGKAEHYNEGYYTVLYAHEDTMTLGKNPVEKGNNHPNNEEIKPAVISLPELQQQFLSLLDKIKIKELDLRDRGYAVAADRAKELHGLIQEKHSDLIEGKIDNPTFKRDCIDAINQARPELEQHRGWKQILGNLAFAIVGLGILYVAAGLINKAVTGSFLFFKTESAKKVEQLEGAINRYPDQEASGDYPHSSNMNA